MKKFLILLLVLAMIPTCCFATSETSDRICDETITITVSGLNTNLENAPWNDTNMAAVIESRFGIHLECTPFDEGTWKTQFTLMLAEDNLPDLILNPQISLAEVVTYGEQGYFYDLKDLINECAPNITAAFEQYPMLKNYSTSPDGNMYTLVQVSPNIIALTPRFWLNKNWMENLGLELPKSLDDVYEVLKAFKEQDANGNGDPNDEIPLGDNIEFTISTFLNAFGFDTRSISYLLQADDEGKVYLGETTEAYKAYLTYMNKLWNEGLLDNEFFTEDGDQFSSKVKADTMGMAGMWAPYLAAGQEIDYDANWYWSGAYTSEYRETPTVVKGADVSGQPWVLVNANTEYAEEIVRLIDFFYTEEGQVAGNQGFEGIDYEYEQVTIPGLEDYKTFVQYCPEGYTSADNYRALKAVICNGFYFVKPFVNTPSYVVLGATTDEQYDALLPTMGWMVQLVRYGVARDDVEVVNCFPALVYTSEEAEERTQLYNDINNYLANMHAQFISGQADIDGDWDTFISQLNAMGLERLLGIEQAAYDRLMGK